MPVNPPRPKGPPLNSLRAFEAAARLGSFAAAADELSVTAGAVSQHIRTLEDWAGVTLFERRAQGVWLTGQGRRLLPDLTIAFDALGGAVRQLRDLSPDRALTIAALPSVAQLWLQPRLARFRAAFPNVNLSISVSESPPNLARDLVDMSLFIGPPDRTPTTIVLARDDLTPVCAPDHSIISLNELAHQTLLHDDTWASDWVTWANANAIPLADPTRGPHFSLYAMAVEEAKAGAGVLIGHTALLDAELKAGRLIEPFPDRRVAGACLVADVADGPHAAALRAFLATCDI